MKKTDTIQDPQELRQELATTRQREEALRTDELERRTAAADHQRALADLDADTRLAELDRAAAQADAEADAELARIYRQAGADGARIRVKSLMARSREARELGLATLRRQNLTVLVTGMVVAGLISAVGVHEGLMVLLPGEQDSSDPRWWAGWVLEPALLGVTCWILYTRTRLAACGGSMAVHHEDGTTSDPVMRFVIGFLSISILLNIAAAPWPSEWTRGSAATLVLALAAQSIAPVLAASIAHLIGTTDDRMADADPAHDEHGKEVQSLEDLVPTLPKRSARGAHEGTHESAPEGASDEAVVSAHEDAHEGAPEAPVVSASPAVWPVPVGGRTVLPIVARPQTDDTPDDVQEKAADAPADTVEERPSFLSDLAEQRASAAAVARASARPNRGVKVPAAARRNTKSARSSSDDELRERLAQLIESGALPVDASVRQVQKALKSAGKGVSHERAKRIMSSPSEAPMAVAS